MPIIWLETDLDKLNALLVEYMEEYNTTFSYKRHLVSFTDTAHHIPWVYQDLRQQRENVLFVGVGGNGC